MAELADLYSGMGAHGFDPRQVDRMEFWEAASILGHHRRQPDPEPERDLVAERIYAHEHGLPPPKPSPPKPPSGRNLKTAMNSYQNRVY